MNAPDPAWAAGIEAVQQQSGGAMTLDIVQPSDVPGLLGAMLAGDAYCARLFHSVSDTVARVAAAPRRHPLLCVSCPRPLRKGKFSIVVLTPRRDDPTNAVGLGVCSRCATSREDIAAKAALGLKRLWPDSRIVDATLQRPAARA